MTGHSPLFPSHEGTTPVQSGVPRRTDATEARHARRLRPGNSITGRSRLLALAALVWLAASSCSLSSRTAASGTRPQSMNVLLITADDLGLQVGAYGETLIQTPNIDGMAATGARFETAYVSQPSCSPSRASIFTGMYAHSTGQYGLVDTGLALHEDLQNATIPNLLKQAGYRTGIIGKLHVNPESSFQFDYRPPVNSQMVQDVAQSVDDFVVSSGDQPFFLMVNYADPHAVNPAVSPTDFVSQVGGYPENPLQPSPAVIFPWQQTDSVFQEQRTAGFYASVQRLDAGIGLLLDTLKNHNLLENTLIIFIGDNGPGFARGKVAMYENGIRTPFIVLWPGVTHAGDVNKAMVTTVDILPTILDAVGQPIPAHVQGESLRSALSDTTYAGRAYLVAENHFHIKKPFTPQRAIRNRRFKLINNLRAGSVTPILSVDGCQAYNVSRLPVYAWTVVRTAFDTFANPPEFELYDLINDPIEFHNLAADPQYQDTLNELKTALTTWRQDTNDPFLDPAVMQYYIDFSLSP